ncbi:MAG: hypothetical protein KDK70_41130, partial [Myxococcales bacterium]|nr:hypothetical protein [Myxococcales bacterium]
MDSTTLILALLAPLALGATGIILSTLRKLKAIPQHPAILSSLAVKPHSNEALLTFEVSPPGASRHTATMKTAGLPMNLYHEYKPGTRWLVRTAP